MGSDFDRNDVEWQLTWMEKEIVGAIVTGVGWLGSRNSWLMGLKAVFRLE